MGFIAWLFRWFGWNAATDASPGGQQLFENEPSRSGKFTESKSTVRETSHKPGLRSRPKLTPTRSDAARLVRRFSRAQCVEVAGSAPYKFARYGSRTGRHLDLSLDGDEAKLRARGLPVFRTPEQLADWLELPLKRLAWLVHRFSAGRPATVEQSHYHYRWQKKRSGGYRLIESPKQSLKLAQIKILREILDRIPAHASAHGFVAGRSIVTNARPHVGHATLVKLDLSNFYATVGFSRVVAIFRTIGYSREAAIWLSLLTTAAIPGNMAFPDRDPYAFELYLKRHLPQGAPTSPAIANLSAYRLDLRLSGLARSFDATYTRYADDLAISGNKDLAGSLRVLIPLVQQIIRRERFRLNSSKRQILRAHQRQSIAGVVVNSKTNVTRAEFDRLKALLTNCLRMGPSTQNRDGVENFEAHLRGRIAHVTQLNRSRGEKLMVLFQNIDWQR